MEELSQNFVLQSAFLKQQSGEIISTNSDSISLFGSKGHKDPQQR